MNNWNRDDRDTYTDINAQRRHRRKPDPERPADPDEGTETEMTPEMESLFAAYTLPKRALSMEPGEIAEPEESGTPDAKETPEETEKQGEADKYEGSGEPEEHEEAEEAAVSEEPGEPDKPEQPAEREEQKEAAAAVHGSDSRIPPEARRMAAAPYGTARPEARRPGTRPQNAYRRLPVQAQERVPVRPRNDHRDAQRAVEKVTDRTSRVRVGYAPGRMSEGMTQKVPVQDAAWEQPAYSRDAKAYLEKRSQPFRTESNRETAGPERQGSKMLRVAVAILVLIGIVITGILVLRDRADKKDTITREVPQVHNFTVSTTEGLTAPADLIFSVETERSVDEIRLYAEGDVDLDTEIKSAEDESVKFWMVKMHVDTGFTGTVILQARRNGDDTWYDTSYTAEVNVESPLNVLTLKPDTEEVTPEPVPEVPDDDDDYYDESEENGATEGQEPEGIPGDEESPVTGDYWVEGEGEDPEDEAEMNSGEDTGDDSGLEPYDDIPTGDLRTPEPTATPAPPEEKPTETPPLTAEAAPEANPDLITGTTIYTSYTKKEKSYNRLAKELIHMPAADEYTTQKLGVLTFRGDNFRRNAAIGELRAAPTEMKVRWDVESGSARGTNQTYYGYGWTGQPVIARWSTQVRTGSNLYEKKINKQALKEVIIAGLDGNIRFLDLEDGELTRNSIKLGYPMRGTPTLHPRGYPFLSVGQFARKMKVKTGKIDLRQYNLYSQKEQKLLDGLDGKYHRPLNDVGSFETSALIDRTSDTLIVAGSNGMLYLEALNSSFDYNANVLTITPSVTVMNYKVKGQKSTALLAIESSPAAYDKYVYMANMGGVLQCIDTNTLTPVWAVDTGDSVMAAVALDLTESRELNLYTANMLNNRKKGNSNIQIRRYDALSGKEIWCRDVGVYKGKKDKDDVGAKASPVIGQHALSRLVYYTVTGLSDDGRQKLGLTDEAPAALIALEKETGEVVWAYGLSSRSESSPLAVYDKEGNGWIIQCEQNGTIHLLEGLTGSTVNILKLDAEIEASPAAYGNMMVIGTTGRNTSYVYGIELKLEAVPGEETEYEENSGGA